jgi:hypothetical protein
MRQNRTGLFSLSSSSPANTLLDARTALEAQKIKESLDILAALRKEVRVTWIIPMYNEMDRLQPPGPGNPYGEDALRKKIRQVAEMQSVSSRLENRLIFVDDGTEDAASQSR